MKIIKDIFSFNSQWDGCVATMGNFDAFHIGHQKLIEKVLQSSSELDLPSVLITYQRGDRDPLPKIVNEKEKVNLLKKKNFTALVNITLDENTKKLSAIDYLTDILINRLKARVIIVGYDHAFGNNRHGNIHFLKKHEAQFNYSSIQIQAVTANNKPVSSSRVREKLETGDIERANILLGRAYNIQSKVIHGLKRGKKIGIPTANLLIPSDKVIPKRGVYYAKVEYKGTLYESLVNIGVNPTFSNENTSIEVHFLNFSKDIYSEVINVFFVSRIRDEIKFSNTGKLKEQIQKDIELAKTISIDKSTITVSWKPLPSSP